MKSMQQLTHGNIDIPASWLEGRSIDDYMVLRVSGNAMFPTFQDGDKLLILQQSELDHSGQMVVVLDDDGQASIRIVELGTGWAKLSPINPQEPPSILQGAAIKQLTILGVPKQLIRCLIP